MPVAFASMTGGVCTLIGTSTNIAVARAMVHHGLKPLGMFELAPVGLGAALVGLVYLVLVAPRLLRQLPPRPHGTEGTREFLYEVFVRPGGGLAGKTLAEVNPVRYGMTVLALVLILVFIALRPSIVLFLLAFGYALSGPTLTLLLIRRHRAKRKLPE